MFDHANCDVCVNNELLINFKYRNYEIKYWDV